MIQIVCASRTQYGNVAIIRADPIACVKERHYPKSEDLLHEGFIRYLKFKDDEESGELSAHYNNNDVMSINLSSVLAKKGLVQAQSRNADNNTLQVVSRTQERSGSLMQLVAYDR